MTNDRSAFASRPRDDKGARYALIYDESCPMCRAWAARIARWDRDRRIELVQSHGGDTAARFPWIPRHELDVAMQLVEPDGTTHAGAAAAEALVRVLPFGRILGGLFAIPGARPVARRVYAAIAARRCRDACSTHVG